MDIQSGVIESAREAGAILTEYRIADGDLNLHRADPLKPDAKIERRLATFAYCVIVTRQSTERDGQDRRVNMTGRADQQARHNQGTSYHHRRLPVAGNEFDFVWCGRRGLSPQTHVSIPV